MKTTFALCCALMTTGLLTAQNFVEDNYEHLMDRETATVVYVSGQLFDYAKHLDVSDDADLQDAKELITSIDAFNLVKVDDLDDPKAEFNKGKAQISDKYDELVRIRDHGNLVNIYIDEDNGTVYEIVALVLADGKDFVAASINGQIELDKISDLINAMNDQGEVPLLSDIAELNMDQFSVYPNPVQAGESVTIDIDETWTDAQMHVYDLSGKLIETKTISSDQESIDTRDLAEGQYVVELSKDGTQMKRKFIVVR